MTFHIENTFDSLAEFLDFLETERPAWRRENLDEFTPAKRFNGKVSYLQAMDLARFGWAEGRELMTDVTSEMSPEDIKVETAEDFQIDVGGAYPVPALAVTGDPACMMDIQPCEREHKIISLCVSLSYRSNMTPQAVTTRGAAVLSYVDALENAGWRCEIWGRSKAVDDDGNSVGLTICLKRAQDHLDIDTLAFAFAHPAFTRRIIFRYREMFPETQRTFARAYGSSVDDRPSGHQAYVPILDNNGLADNEYALAHVGSRLDKTLKPAA